MSFRVKLLLTALVLTTSVFIFIPPAIAQEEPIVVDFFDDRLCSVCGAAKEFMLGLKDDYPHMELRIHSISDVTKLKEVSESRGYYDYKVVAPTIFIGDNLFRFNEFTYRQKEMIRRALEGETVEDDTFLIRIPILNREVDITNWSLFLIAAVLGSIDGFNVCSIGALVLILSIVITLDSRRKIFLYGGAFILTTVTIYGTMVFAWGRLFEAFAGHLEIMRIIIGLASLGGGIYFFKEFWRFFRYGPTCQASNSKIVNSAVRRLRKVLETPNKGPFFIVGSVMLFAAVITIVEFPCSVGVPIIFTGILAEQGLSLLAHTSYILIFLFFYMLDEAVIFTGAVLTKKIWFAGSKMTTWVTFIGAMVLFYLAFFYLFS